MNIGDRIEITKAYSMDTHSQSIVDDIAHLTAEIVKFRDGGRFVDVEILVNGQLSGRVYNIARTRCRKI